MNMIESDVQRVFSSTSKMTISESIQRVSQYLHNVYKREEDEREFYEEWFHKLVLSIFGYDKSVCWLQEAERNAVVYDQLLNLLKPDGLLFNLMFMYLKSSTFYVRYEFPRSKLPLGTKTMIEKNDWSSIPRFYQNKLQTSPNSDSIGLNAKQSQTTIVEPIIQAKFTPRGPRNAKKESKAPFQSPTNNGWMSKVQNFLKIHDEPSTARAPRPNIMAALLISYLKYFFPYTKDSYQSTTSTRVSELESTQKTLLADSFLSILLDFWLNQYCETETGVTQFAPSFLDNSSTIINLSAIVVRHILMNPEIRRLKPIEETSDQFSRLGGYSVAQVLPIFVSSIQSPLFNFIRSVFNTPQDATLSHDSLQLQTISLWMVYLEPWKIQHENFDETWHPYVYANWSFYSILFTLFMKSLATIEIYNTAPAALEKVKYVVEFFSNAELFKLLKSTDDLIEHEKEKFNGNFVVPNTQESSLSIILRDHLTAFLGSPANYPQIFSANLTYSIATLVRNCHSVLTGLRRSGQNAANVNTIVAIEMGLGRMFDVDSALTASEQRIETDNYLRDEDTPPVSASQQQFLLQVKRRKRDAFLEEPYDEKHLGKLSEDQKYDFLSRGFKFSKTDVPFVGDEFDKPVTSVEFAFLVRIFTRLSLWLNRKLKLDDFYAPVNESDGRLLQLVDTIIDRKATHVNLRNLANPANMLVLVLLTLPVFFIFVWIISKLSII